MMGPFPLVLKTFLHGVEMMRAGIESRRARPLLIALLGATFSLPASLEAQGVGDPQSIAAIQAFLAEGFGALSPDAPPETRDFGRLVGLWRTEQSVMGPEGSWMGSAPGYWAWKYALGGFAVRDLWFQPEADLTPNMTHLNRDYMLTGMRIYDVRANEWKVAWMANGRGTLQGADFGTFVAEEESGNVIMSGPPIPGVGHQRVKFEGITDDSFEWYSEFSQDGGETWIAVMRVRATRIAS